MPIVSDDENSDSDQGMASGTKQKKNQTQNNDIKRRKIQNATVLLNQNVINNQIPQVQFLSAADRDRQKEEIAERERRANRQKEIDASRKRKQFLFQDPREMERMQQRSDRRGGQQSDPSSSRLQYGSLRDGDNNNSYRRQRDNDMAGSSSNAIPLGQMSSGNVFDASIGPGASSISSQMSMIPPNQPPHSMNSMIGGGGPGIQTQPMSIGPGANTIVNSNFNTQTSVVPNVGAPQMYLSAKQAAALDPSKNMNIPSTQRMIAEKKSSSLHKMNLLSGTGTGSGSNDSGNIDDIMSQNNYQLSMGHLNLTQQELNNIKKQYLGIKDERKRVSKPSEKFRTIFNFEWDASEDTYKNDTNDLFAKRPDPQLLFGRGYKAGIDVREQRKNNNFYETLISRKADMNGEDCTSFLSKRQELFEQLARQQDGNFKKGSGDGNDDGTEATALEHWSTKDLSEMTARDWKIFREDNSIYLRGGRVPLPMRTWAESNLPIELLDAVNKVGYTKPTPIQMQAIPVALSLRDLIASAETGSGKTAAYCLPLLAYLKDLPQLDAESAQLGPYGVILSPSRELANQITDELAKFKQLIPQIRTCVLVGGTNGEQQAFQIRTGVELIIATPGRLADALSKQHTVLHQCNYVILDELDMMLEPPMDDFVYRILNSIPSTNMKSEDEEAALKQELEALSGGIEGFRKYRITQMFTATLNHKAEKLARTYCRCPSIIRIGDDEFGAGVAKNKNIEQRVKLIADSEKKRELEILFNESDFATPCIIFVNTKRAADILSRWVNSLGYKVSTFHAGRSQQERDLVMKQFRENSLDFLCATNVLGRGIDLPGLPWVINFDMPHSIKEYGHRVGRTGRAGKKGIAASFLTEGDKEVFYDLKQYLIECGQEVPVGLAHSEHARVKPGTLTESGKLAGSGGGKIIYAK